MKSTNNISIGNSGEYFVAAELERRGFTAAVPMSNTKDFDVLAINTTTHRQVALQIKTNRTKSKSWMLTKKSENVTGENIYYIFVCLNDMDAPEYYIVESHIVAESLQKGYEAWLSSPGKNNKQHNETSMRKFEFDSLGVNNIFNLKSENYKSKWDKLK